MAAEPLYVSFFSIIVKRAAVVRKFPGGAEEFDRLHQPARGDEELSVMMVMSLGDVDHVLDRLFLQGLIPGQDLAVAEMTHGPLLGCPGVTFESEGKGIKTWWMIIASSDPDAGAGCWDGHTAYSPNPLGYWWTAPEPKPQPTVQPLKPPPGLTANQFYQWWGLQRWPEDEDDEK